MTIARRHGWSVMAGVLALMLLSGCGDDDGANGAEGTWVHPEEGTIVLESDGTGSIVQSSDPVAFEWEQDDDTIQFSFEFDDEVGAEATLDGDELTFRAGDFSGDDPVTFTRQ